MSCLIGPCLAGWAGLAVFAVASGADSPDAKPDKPSPATYTLRYKFQPSETVRWKVTHRARVESTVSGTSQTAESVSTSTKVWRVQKVEPSGAATFEQLVENVDMWQRVSGRAEVRYNSQTDKQAPVIFENVAKSVGVVLARTTIDPQGKILSRQQVAARPQTDQQEGQITIPLPDKPVAVGQTWAFPYEIEVPLAVGRIRRVKSRQSFTLEEVRDNVATVRVATQILTPIDDPAIEAKLVQRESSGTVTFDIEAGRVIAQQTDIDKRVVGFQGEASSLHFRTRFNEELVKETATAGKGAQTAQAAPKPVADAPPKAAPKPPADGTAKAPAKVTTAADKPPQRQAADSKPGVLPDTQAAKPLVAPAKLPASTAKSDSPSDTKSASRPKGPDAGGRK